MTEYFKSKYLDDNGDIHPIRLSVSNRNLVGPAPTGEITSPVRAEVKKTKRKFGLKPRGVMIEQRIPQGGSVRVNRAFVPLLTREWFDADWLVIGKVWGVADPPWLVTSKKEESYG